MNLRELQAWLVNEGLRSDLDLLTRLTVRGELDNLIPEEKPEESMLIVDWPRLLLAGSVLARSELRSHQEAALRIATGAVSLPTSQEVTDAGAVLLGKLANFRAISLAATRQLLPPNLDARLGVSLRMEAQRRQLEHSVLVQSSGRWMEVNDFQRRFWNSASDHSWLSASAPTASGKTFLVLQWLVDQLRSTDIRIAVYLAPTRALVSEIENSLLLLLGQDGDIEVSSLPLKAQYNTAVGKRARLVLVFTQERLHLLANALRDQFRVDLLIVDEAHKIGDNQRGVILQDAVERVSRANTAIKLVFISPATQNPEELLADAPADARTASVDSDAPTVLQNLIVAEQVPRKPKHWALAVRKAGDSLPIGVLQLGSSPAGLRKRLAFIAAAVGERGGTLVYVNGAAESEKVADLISQLLPPVAAPDRQLLELADLARKGVHPQFKLAQLVEGGVAFHYGNLPSLLRLEVERLFRSGKIRFLVCTSTLIEGVNLSCRTIVLRGPRKGIGHPMEPHDFWNLAGRAGRWGDEFQGNIVCIDPRDSTAWPNGIPERSRYPIKRESDAVVELDARLVAYLDARASSEPSELEDADIFEQVGAYLLTTYLRLGSIRDASIAKRHSPSTIARLEQTLSHLATQIEISPEIAGRHPGVSALGLQRLLNAFRSYEGDPENLVPAPVDSEDSYSRFVTIMGRINSHLYPAFLPEKRIPLHALIVVQWLKGYSLSSMIKRNIGYHKDRGRSFRLPELIRDTMELVEQTARFRAPKYFSAYVDILHLHLRNIGREDLIEADVDIGTQLEFGVSAQTLFSLMELGLSRMSAVMLYEKIAQDNLSKEGCLAWINERVAQFDGMDIPAIVVREIRERLLATTRARRTR